MMKNILLIFFLFLSYNVVAQNPSQQTPTQFSTGWFRQGWPQADSGTILAPRMPNFTPRFIGTTIIYPQVGADTSIHYWTGARWIKINPSGTDTTSLSIRINLKQDILSNAGITGDSLLINNSIKRLQNDYGLTFSTNATKVLMFIDTLGSNHVVTTSQLKDTAAAIRNAIGSGGLTSVGLSMPLAFTVTNSPLTSNGTISVSGAGASTQYIRGNGTLATTDTGMIPNFYLKVRGLISGSSPIVFNQTNGLVSINDANVSGGKGAATFTGAFSDNGSGLIDLVDLLTPGSCTNCDITFDAKGRATAYSNGSGGGGGLSSITNTGSGYRWVAAPNGVVKTASGSNTILIDSSSNSNALTFKADTSVLATQYDLTQIVPSLAATQVAFGSVGNTITSEATFNYLAASNKLSVDSLLVIQSNQDSSLFIRQSPYLPADTLLTDGNSITVGLNATSTSLAYAYMLASAQGLTISNIAVSGTGMVSIANRHLINKNPGNTVMSTVMGGLNDVRRNGVARKTLNKIINGYKSIFANQYLESFTNAGTGGVGVTRYGSWTSNWNAQAEGGKATVGAYTSTTNDSIVYVFTDSTVIVGLMGGDGSASSYIGTDVDVYIDGTLVTTINTNDQTDGVADGSGLDNKRCAMSFYFGGLSFASHSIKLVKKSTGGGGFLICDYFGHFIPRPTAYAMLWFHAPYLKGIGYATVPNNANNDAIDSVNNKIDSLVNTDFIKWYPTWVVETNNCYDTTTGTDADGIHPNDVGHSQIYACAINRINEINGGGGATGKMYYSNEFRGVVEGVDDAFLMLRRADLRYIQNQDNITQSATFKIDGEGTLSRITTDGSISGASLSVTDRQRAGFVSGVNGPLPFFGIRNNQNATDSKTYDWFLGTGGIQFRILSDDLMTSADYLRMVRSGMVIDTIQMPKLDITGKLKIYTIDSSASPENMLWQDPVTKEIKKAAVPSGGGLSGSGTANQLTFWSGASSLTSNYTMQRVANSDGEGLEVQNDGTGVGVGNGAVLNLYLNNASPSGTDRLGEFHFYGNNSSATKKQLTAIYAEADGVTAGAENGIQLMNITVNGSIKEFFKASKSNSNVKLRLANTALIDEDNSSVNLGDISDLSSTFKYQKSVNGAMSAGFVNPNTGSGAYSELQVTSSNILDVAQSLRMLRLGDNWTTVGAYKQKGAAIQAADNLTGGLSIMATGLGAKIRFNTGSYIDDSTRLVIGHLDSTGSPANMLWINPNTRELMIAAVPSGGSTTTLYTGDGSLSGNRSVTGSGSDLTFLTIDQFRINSNLFVLSKNNATIPYTSSILGSGNQMWVAYTPTAGNYTKGTAFVLDTNNNISLGSNIITSSAPLYAIGGSVHAGGFQSSEGNFYKVSNVTGNLTAGIQDNLFVIDATSGNITITLPAASASFGATMGLDLIFKRIDNSGNTVTIQRAGSDTIDGTNSFTLTTQWESKKVRCLSTSTWGIY